MLTSFFAFAPRPPGTLGQRRIKCNRCPDVNQELPHFKFRRDVSARRVGLINLKDLKELRKHTRHVTALVLFTLLNSPPEVCT